MQLGRIRPADAGKDSRTGQWGSEQIPCPAPCVNFPPWQKPIAGIISAATQYSDKMLASMKSVEDWRAALQVKTLCAYNLHIATQKLNRKLGSC